MEVVHTTITKVKMQPLMQVPVEMVQEQVTQVVQEIQVVLLIIFTVLTVKTATAELFG